MANEERVVCDFQNEQGSQKKTIEHYTSLPYRLEIVQDEEEGGFTAYYPELLGCATCGETFESVIANAEDAKRAWIAAAWEEGLEIAEPAMA